MKPIDVNSAMYKAEAPLDDWLQYIDDLLSLINFDWDTDDLTMSMCRDLFGIERESY